MHGLESTARPSLLRRLDYVPAWLAIALGVGAGALLGIGLAMTSPMFGGVGFVALLGRAVALAFSGEPITVLVRTSEPAAEVEPARSSETVPEPEPARSKLGVELVRIPAGTFQMGSPDDAKPVHEVRISAFECMRFSVTRRLYKEVTGNDPGWPEGEADERPVNNVSWHDAVRFCSELQLRAVVEEGLGLPAESERSPRYSVRDLKAFQLALPIQRKAAEQLGAEHPATVALRQVLEHLARGCHRFDYGDKAEAYRQARDAASLAVCELVLCGNEEADALVTGIEQVQIADETLIRLRSRLRLAGATGYLNETQMLHALERADAIGRQLGGWLRALGPV